MKREPTFYLSLAACGLAACCLWQAIAVREELDNLSRDMRNLNHTVQDQVSSIYSTVNRALEEEASILAEEDFTFGQVDMEARTVELLCRVLPKEATDTTTAALSLADGTTWPMQRQADSFTAAIPVSLFDQVSLGHITFRDGDVSRSQALSYGWTPRHDFLPNIWARFSGTSARYDHGSTEATWQGDVDLDVDGKLPIKLTRPQLVVFLDGKEIHRETLKLESFYTHLDGEPLDDSQLEKLEYLAAESDDAGMYSGFSARLPLFYTTKVPVGSTVTFHLETKDDLGFVYRVQMDSFTMNENGERTDHHTPTDGAYIYSPEGELLFDGSY